MAYARAGCDLDLKFRKHSFSPCMSSHFVIITIVNCNGPSGPFSMLPYYSECVMMLCVYWRLGSSAIWVLASSNWFWLLFFLYDWVWKSDKSNWFPFEKGAGYNSRQQPFLFTALFLDRTLKGQMLVFWNTSCWAWALPYARLEGQNFSWFTKWICLSLS